MTITLDLTPEEEKKLRAAAKKSGKSANDFTKNFLFLFLENGDLTPEDWSAVEESRKNIREGKCFHAKSIEEFEQQLDENV